MEIVVLPDPDSVARLSAALVADAVRGKAEPVLGLATGSSPLGTYRELRRLVESGALDLSRASGFALDEYVGIPEDHPQSYAAVIRSEVVEPLGMDPARVRVPDGRADDLERACREYEEAIAAAGGVDVQILGVGANGHIGFNEPTSSFGSRTRIKTLAERTRADNARFFDSPDEVPTHCLTQGLATILAARRVVLVAQGAAKATAIGQIVEGPVSARWPGSILQHHPAATVVVDEAAAAELELADYYRFVWEHKPSWQRVEPLPA
ncbi:glucosamine-6-phosphate deaminase [Amnibacterium sp. CER49]|uniref:glucosamine-6-phosphate deaminase n=1 Tax=Amnibacterium sp. CER49 TaxID=3039161 RepID=UPI00244A2BC0|nr:glucosamine-6-phosphate deaminase [Amnibacterium sp. CER49]MDH2444254.1 glucosamine-6-phosphate deaminase [Amnibacterium sp. CER49]